MLREELEEAESMWLDFDFEESQVRLDLADMVLETLMEEAILVIGVSDEKLASLGDSSPC